MAFDLKWMGNDVLISYYDEVSFFDFNQVNEIIYGDPRFDGMKFQCVDLLKINMHNLNLDDIKIISALETSASQWKKNLKIAHVTNNSEAIEYIKLYESQFRGSNWQFQVFDTVDKALVWCNT